MLRRSPIIYTRPIGGIEPVSVDYRPASTEYRSATDIEGTRYSRRRSSRPPRWAVAVVGRQHRSEAEIGFSISVAGVPTPVVDASIADVGSEPGEHVEEVRKRDVDVFGVGNPSFTVGDQPTDRQRHDDPVVGVP